jgi:hypothetical protein
VVKFLSQEWLDLLREVGGDAPERPGAGARVQFTAKDGPDGDVVLHLVVTDGRLVGAGLGPDPAGGSGGVALVASHTDTLAIARGELDPTAAFMQGRVKVTGDMTQLFALLPLAQTADAADRIRRVAAETEL